MIEKILDLLNLRIEVLEEIIINKKIATNEEMENIFKEKLGEFKTKKRIAKESKE